MGLGKVQFIKNSGLVGNFLQADPGTSLMKYLW
jgi:hypothetical protein